MYSGTAASLNEAEREFKPEVNRDDANAWHWTQPADPSNKLYICMNEGNTPSLMVCYIYEHGNNPNAVNALEANKHCSMLTGAFALQFCPVWLQWQHVSFTGPLRDQSYISQSAGLQSDWNTLVCSQMITYNTWHLEIWNCHSIAHRLIWSFIKIIITKLKGKH